jgi:hypothetical protein
MTRHSILPGQSVFITGRNLAQAVCARGFAKRLVHVADFEKASRKETENASKLFVDCFRLCCSLPANRAYECAGETRRRNVNRRKLSWPL